MAQAIRTKLLNNLPFITAVVFFWILYSYISIVKHQHYQTFVWDTGFFDQLIWKLSRFKDPVSSFSGLQAFGDHFQPVLLFFVPLYWFSYSLPLLLIAQAAIAAFSTIPIYLLSLKFLKDKFLSLVICVSYLLFVPLQFAILDGFHQSVFSTSFYSLALYAIFLRKNKLYWVSIIGLLITKEEMALLAAAIGAVVFIMGEKLKGLTTIVVSLATFFVAINIILPSIQGYYPHYGYGELGKTPIEVIINSIKHPDLFIRNLFYPSVKIKTVLQTFLSFGFLSVFSPTLLIPAIQQFVVRFLDTVTTHRWLNLNHYSFPISPIMAIATIFSIKKLMQKFTVRINLIAIYLLIFTLLQDYTYHGPINSLLKKDFYVKQQWMKNNDEILNFVPKNASVATTNNFGPHISQRDEFYLVDQNSDAKYILLDLEDGPNKYFLLSYQQTLEIYLAKVKSGQYAVEKQIGQAVLLKKTI